MKINLKKISEFVYEIPKQGNMLVPGRIYASKDLLHSIINDESLQQVKNVATLPGIVSYSIAMPDIHEGYGFPIGGVAAVNIDDGYISPGGVGYDINCGVRLIKTNLFYKEIKDKTQNILLKLYNKIPAGVGSKNAIKSLSNREFKKVLKKGAKWAISNGYGYEEDLDFIEDNGCISNEGAEIVSERAIERGKNQLGTLGSGNHFIEIQVVDEIFNFDIANQLALEKGQVTILFHTGSRGFGYQVCDDFLNLMRKNISKFKYNPPDRQLIALPFSSDIGQRYFNAMNAAANFAWANRQIIKTLIENVFLKVLKISPKDLGFKQIYDVCHNIAKVEFYNNIKLLVHRKGATRAIGKNSSMTPEPYKNIGQPVIIPGDMGTASYLLVGTEKAEKETFGSCCHGAGRLLSRKKALKKFRSLDILASLEKEGIYLMAKSKRTIAEEVPDAYKNIDEVIEVVSSYGLANKVARFKPIGVVKG